MNIIIFLKEDINKIKTYEPSKQMCFSLSLLLGTWPITENFYDRTSQQLGKEQDFRDTQKRF